MDTFSRYKKIKRLGGGEYSEVYLCHDDEVTDCDSGHNVVVKAFRTKQRKVKRQIKKGDHEYSNRLLSSFTDEAAITARFSHSNIITVLENTALADGTPYFVMPYHPGTVANELWGSSLPQKKGLPIKPDRTIMLVKQIYAALMEIHRHGIVHRDIKPQNVLLDVKENAILCDFGHALNLSIKSSPHLRRQSKNFGTPPFVSTEQQNNPETVDGRSDIYSLGVLTYLMITGVMPVVDPVPPIHINEMIDIEVSNWIMQAMNSDPTQRPTNIACLLTS